MYALTTQKLCLISLPSLLNTLLYSRHFLGVMALWLEPDTLERKVATLACRRMVGSVTYDRLAVAINDIMEEYGLQGKVTRVVTDNGSNFVKAFR